MLLVWNLCTGDFCEVVLSLPCRQKNSCYGPDLPIQIQGKDPWRNLNTWANSIAHQNCYFLAPSLHFMFQYCQCKCKHNTCLCKCRCIACEKPGLTSDLRLKSWIIYPRNISNWTKSNQKLVELNQMILHLAIKQNQISNLLRVWLLNS